MTKQQKTEKLEDLQQQLQAVQQELTVTTERERRALADYQNLLRRNQSERARLLEFANQELIESLLQPLEHLKLAASQIEDEGLQMVVKDFWRVMKQAGLEEINPIGEPFDVETMEAVEREDDGEIVTKVVRHGYKLHDQVIQHAQVIVGKNK